MDVENLDVGRLHRKVSGLLLRYGVDDDLPLNNSRRQALHDREGIVGYRAAERFKIRQKSLDNMVQLLYMARQKLRMMEESEFFDTKSFGFRIAYSHRKSQRLWRNIGIISKYAFEHTYVMDIKYHLILHHKAARLHVDYMYLFWLIVKLDVANKERKRRTTLINMIKAGMSLPEHLSIPLSWG